MRNDGIQEFGFIGFAEITPKRRNLSQKWLFKAIFVYQYVCISQKMEYNGRSKKNTRKLKTNSLQREGIVFISAKTKI